MVGDDSERGLKGSKEVKKVGVKGKREGRVKKEGEGEGVMRHKTDQR